MSCKVSEVTQFGAVKRMFSGNVDATISGLTIYTLGIVVSSHLDKLFPHVSRYSGFPLSYSVIVAA